MSRKTSRNSVMKVKRLNLSSQDAVGGIVQTKTTVFKAACRVRQLNADERAVGGKNGVVSTHRVYCDVLDVRSADEIVIGKIIYDVNTISPGSHKKSLEVDVTFKG